MNFDKWFDSGGLWAHDPYISASRDMERGAAQVGWGACKNEVLKILEENLPFEEGAFLKLKKEIENL